MTLRLEILLSSYWEHFKYAKDLGLILPVDHPKRVVLEKEMAGMMTEIHKEKGGQDVLQV